jgi:hypothetical protein
MRTKLQTESARWVASGSKSAGAGQTQNQLSREKERNTPMNPAPTRFNTIKEGIKMKLITIATVGTAIALIGFCCLVLLQLRWLSFPALIAWLIGAAALIADIFLRGGEINRPI